jgi:hypothetical protein
MFEYYLIHSGLPFTSNVFLWVSGLKEHEWSNNITKTPKYLFNFSLTERQFYSKREEELNWTIVEPGAIVPFTFNEHGNYRKIPLSFIKS